MAKIEMPKNSSGNPEVDVIAEDITTALARIDWLLNGNVDADNIVHKENGTDELKLLIPASKVQDIPLISNEIASRKIFRSEFGNNSFSELVWTPLKDTINSNPVFSVIGGELAILIDKTVKIYDTEQVSVTQHKKDPYTYYRSMLDYKLIVEIPTTHRPVTYNRLFEITGENPVVFETITQGKLSRNDYAIEFAFHIEKKLSTERKTYVFRSGENAKPAYFPETNTVQLDIKPIFISGDPITFGDDEFVNIFITMDVLCEERV